MGIWWQAIDFQNDPINGNHFKINLHSDGEFEQVFSLRTALFIQSNILETNKLEIFVNVRDRGSTLICQFIIETG